MKNKTDSPAPAAKPTSKTKQVWSFQIKSRTLGCSLKEWLDSFSSGNP